MPNAAPEQSNYKLQVSTGTKSGAQKIVIYGPGGIGKTSLAATIAKIGMNPFFIDLDDGTKFMDVGRTEPVPETFTDVTSCVQQLIKTDYDPVVVDSFTKAEELTTAHTLATVKHEKGHFVNSIEGYGFGKGYTHVYESFLLLLQALDTAVRAGKSIIGICHECTANVPNPMGEDFIRYEPRLQSPPSGRGSIRHRVKEWCDHLLFVGWDVFVTEDGKASGSGSRTIYPVEMPTHWAKSRLISDPIPYDQGSFEVWKQLFGTQERKAK